MTTVLSSARASAAMPRCGNCGGELTDGRCPRCSPPGGVAPAGIDSEYWSAPPARFQHYEIEREADGRLRELGRGGMGVTYLARDLNLGRQVVLKFIRPELFSNPTVERRFLHEARLAARLHHQNIATVLHLGQEGRRWFYAMEWVPGQTLDQMVKCSGRLDEDDALEVVRQVAHALAEAERMQLVHRDIKPSNVMVQRTDGKLHAKVIDFGLAKLLEPGEGADATMHTQDGMLGTPHYASPEQLREERVDIRSDFYSLGATAWFALTGRTLYEGSRAAVVAQHLQPPKGAPLSHFHSVAMSRRWIELLSALLALRADDRPPNSAALITLIEGGSAQGPARWRNAIRYARPLTKRLFFAAAALILSAVAWKSWPRASPTGESSVGSDAPTAIAAPPLQNGDMALTSAAELVTRGDSFRRRLTTADNEYAVALYLRAIHVDRTFTLAHAMLASAYSQRYLRYGFGREWLAAAAAEAQRAHDLDPASATGLRALGGVRYAEGKLAEAGQFYERALVVAPDDAFLLVNLAGINRDRGNLEEARSYVERAVTLRPKESAIWSIRGNIEKLRENDALALKFYEEATRLSPATAEPRLGTAHVYFLNRRFEDAAKVVAEAEELSGDLADVLCLRAQIYLRDDAFAEAEAALRRAISIKRAGNPYYYGQVRYLSLLGWLRDKLGAKEEGRRLLEEAMQLDKDELQAGTESGEVRYSLAATLLALGRDAEGFTFLKDAIAHGCRSARTAALDRRLDRVREQVEEVFRRASPPAR